MNDVIMEERFEKNLCLQIEANRNQEKKTKELMKMNLSKMHAQRKFQKTSWKNIFMLGLLLCESQCKS